MRQCGRDEMGDAAVSSLCYGTTTQDTGSVLDSSTSSSDLSFEDNCGTTGESSFESCESDVPSTLTDDKIDWEIIKSEEPLLDVRKDLMQRLKHIRAIDYSLQFCSILIKAEISSSYDAEFYQMTEKFLNDLKKMEDAHIDIVETLLEVLHATEAKDLCSLELENLRLFFDHVKTSNYSFDAVSTKIKEVLKKVTRLMELFCNEDLYYSYFGAVVEQPEKNLPMLKDLIFRFGSSEAYSVIGRVYSIYRDELDISKEEEEIKSLLIGATKYIKLFVDDMTFPFKTQLSMMDLQVRSSLQFIADYLTDASVKNEMDSIISIQHDFILKLCEEASKKKVKRSNYVNFDDEDYEDVDEVIEESSKMPQHDWWKNYLNAYFEK